MLVTNSQMDAESDDNISVKSPQTSDNEGGHRPRSAARDDNVTNRQHAVNKLPTLPAYSGGEATTESFPVDFLKTLQVPNNFYNNFGMNMLAPRTMFNVKQEPGNTGEGNRRDLPSNKDNHGRQSSSVQPTASVGVRMSPKALAESLQSNDAASMVFRRSKKHKAHRKQNHIYNNPLAPPSGGENSYNHIDTINLSGGNGGEISIGVSSNNPPSSTLHHFTTRYTIESPSDPSRMGIELVLNHDNEEPVIEVECGGNNGLLYINKLCQGSKGQSIFFNNDWLTPNEFQFVSGRETAKDWKRSIRHCGKSLKTLMTKGILQVHPPVCECMQCREHQQNHSMRGAITPPNPTTTSTSISTSNNPPLDDAGKPMTPKPLNTDKWNPKNSAGSGLNTIISQLHSRAANEHSSTSNAESVASPATDGNESSHSVTIATNTRKRALDNDGSTSEEETSTQHRKNMKQTEHPKQFNGNQRRDQLSFMPQPEQFNPMLSIFNPTLTPMERQRQMYAHLFTSMLAGDKNKQPSFPLFDQQRKRNNDVNYKRSSGFKKKPHSSNNQRLDSRQRFNDLPKPTFTPAWPAMNGWPSTEFTRPAFYGGMHNGNKMRLEKMNFNEQPSSSSSIQPSNDVTTLKDVNNNEPKDTPMVVLQKHDNEEGSVKRANENCNMNISKDVQRRQSSSAPPPPSGQDKIQQEQRPTSAHTKSSKVASVDEPLCLKKEVRRENNSLSKTPLLDGISKLSEWSVNDVCVYIRSIGPMFHQYAKVFEEHSINGRALMLLTERHMVDEMGLKLGHALNILSRVRERLGILSDLFKCCHNRDVDTVTMAANRFHSNQQ